jgi:uncharacterized membrane protein
MNGYGPGGPMQGGMPPGGMWGPHAAPWWTGPAHVVTVLLLVALIAVAVWGVLRLTNQRAALATGAVRANDPAGAALRLRYARGEISREEYLGRAADLGLAPGAAPEAPPAQE